MPTKSAIAGVKAFKRNTQHQSLEREKKKNEQLAYDQQHINY